MAATNLFPAACNQCGTSANRASRDPDTWSHRVPEAARELGISDRAMYRLIERGLLRSYKAGGSRRVLHADLLDFIARQRGIR